MRCTSPWLPGLVPMPGPTATTVLRSSHSLRNAAALIEPSSASFTGSVISSGVWPTRVPRSAGRRRHRHQSRAGPQRRRARHEHGSGFRARAAHHQHVAEIALVRGSLARSETTRAKSPASSSHSRNAGFDSSTARGVPIGATCSAPQRSAAGGKIWPIFGAVKVTVCAARIDFAGRIAAIGRHARRNIHRHDALRRHPRIHVANHFEIAAAGGSLQAGSEQRVDDQRGRPQHAARRAASFPDREPPSPRHPPRAACGSWRPRLLRV